MGFKYVLIPADPGEEIQELTFARPVTLKSDPFRETLQTFYNNVFAGADRAVAIAQLNEAAGNKLEQQLDADQLSKASDRADIDIFPIMMPEAENEFRCVSAYLEDQEEISKDAKVNTRASELLQACGFPNKQFRGDVFFSKVFDHEVMGMRGEWDRVDFTAADCSPDAHWVRHTKEQQEKKRQRNAEREKEKLQVKPEAISGETNSYTWKQTDDEIEITFKREGLQKSDAKLVKVEFSPTRIKVDVKGEILMDGSLRHTIDSSGSAWTISDGILQVTLTKAKVDETWMELFNKPTETDKQEARHRSEIDPIDLLGLTDAQGLLDDNSVKQQEVRDLIGKVSNGQGILTPWAGPLYDKLVFPFHSTVFEPRADFVEYYIPVLIALTSFMLVLTSPKKFCRLRMHLWGSQ